MAAKPAPVKRRPPTACRFYFAEFAVPPRLYLRQTPPVLAHLANALYLVARRRRLPRRLVSLLGRSDCAPRTSLPSFPRAVHLFHLEPRRLAYTTPSNGPEHNDDAMMGAESKGQLQKCRRTNRRRLLSQ